MSISLRCYSTLPSEEAQDILNALTVQHPGMFTERYLIYGVNDLRGKEDYSSTIALEIALEHGMQASCTFSIALNDKSVSDLMSVVIALIKNAFGNSNLLILFNGEERV
jgi:hypothetical protein